MKKQIYVTYNRDLGFYLNKTLTNNDREIFLLSKWCPLKEFEFPVDSRDTRNLRFQIQ